MADARRTSLVLSVNESDELRRALTGNLHAAFEFRRFWFSGGYFLKSSTEQDAADVEFSEITGTHIPDQFNDHVFSASSAISFLTQGIFSTLRKNGCTFTNTFKFVVNKDQIILAVNVVAHLSESKSLSLGQINWHLKFIPDEGMQLESVEINSHASELSTLHLKEFILKNRVADAQLEGMIGRIEVDEALLLTPEKLENTTSEVLNINKETNWTFGTNNKSSHLDGDATRNVMINGELFRDRKLPLENLHPFIENVYQTRRIFANTPLKQFKFEKNLTELIKLYNQDMFTTGYLALTSAIHHALDFDWTDYENFKIEAKSHKLNVFLGADGKNYVEDLIEDIIIEDLKSLHGWPNNQLVIPGKLYSLYVPTKNGFKFHSAKASNALIYDLYMDVLDYALDDMSLKDRVDEINNLNEEPSQTRDIILAFTLPIVGAAIIITVGIFTLGLGPLAGLIIAGLAQIGLPAVLLNAISVPAAIAIGGVACYVAEMVITGAVALLSFIGEKIGQGLQASLQSSVEGKEMVAVRSASFDTTDILKEFESDSERSETTETNSQKNEDDVEVVKNASSNESSLTDSMEQPLQNVNQSEVLQKRRNSRF